MGQRRSALTADDIEFIQQQKIFFVASSPTDINGFVNCSPKGLDTLRVINPQTVVWLNLTGSGNETAAHVLENARMTLMFCSFEERSIILRAYGKAKVFHAGAALFDEYKKLFGEMPGTRQFFELNIEMVQASCGLSVPYYEFKSDRNLLLDWAQKKGDQIRDYWFSRNNKTINDQETGIKDIVQ